MHPEWGAARSIAVQERQSIKSLKIQQQEMQVEKKKYVMLIVWHKVRSVCLSLLFDVYLL
jgi:hypothetical protein